MRKIIDIAKKDLIQSSRSLMGLVFMFAVPALMTSLIYFMFGGTGDEDSQFTVPKTSVVIANLDQGDQIVFESDTFTLESQSGIAEITIVSDDGTELVAHLPQSNSMALDTETFSSLLRYFFHLSTVA